MNLAELNKHIDNILTLTLGSGKVSNPNIFRPGTLTNYKNGNYKLTVARRTTSIVGENAQVFIELSLRETFNNTPTLNIMQWNDEVIHSITRELTIGTESTPESIKSGISDFFKECAYILDNNTELKSSYDKKVTEIKRNEVFGDFLKYLV